MSTAVEIILLVVAGAGHIVLWVSLINRLHGLAIPERLIEAITLVCWALMTLVLATVSLGFFFEKSPWTCLLYLIPCALLAIYSLGRRFLERWQSHSAFPHSTPTQIVDIEALHSQSLASDPRTKWFSQLPKNQIFQLHLQRKAIPLNRLDEKLDGLTLAHLSDLHISGRIEPAFYEEVVHRTNAESPDLIMITGDLFDSQACVDWGVEILGKLRAQHGVYFVLGNHDQRVHSESLRQKLSEKGLINLGSRWKKIDVLESPIILAGNELPWFGPAADMENCHEKRSPDGPLRILLSHAPDQIEWARRFGFDLMLAGHTHGGQIRLPWLGPIVAPSRLGTQYASGTFHLSPTLLHVSRGVSSLTPLRWNCPPELALLTLQSNAQTQSEP